MDWTNVSWPESKVKMHTHVLKRAVHYFLIIFEARIQSGLDKHFIARVNFKSENWLLWISDPMCECIPTFKKNRACSSRLLNSLFAVLTVCPLWINYSRLFSGLHLAKCGVQPCHALVRCFCFPIIRILYFNDSAKLRRMNHVSKQRIANHTLQ